MTKSKIFQPPEHPGQKFLSVLKRNEIMQTTFAREANLSVKHVNSVVHGKARMTPVFALAAEEVLWKSKGWMSAEKWMQLQVRFDLYEARLAAGQLTG